MPGQSTSQGQKVTPGQDAPTAREPAGSVPDGSLAAESVRAGGAFSENRDAQPDASASSRSAAPAPPGQGKHHQQTAPGTASASGQGGPAPTYAGAQAGRDEKGPHGKNLTEGGFAGSGPGNSIDAEPGSKNDPARSAGQGFVGGPGQGGRGNRQQQAGGGGGGFDGEQPFGALKPETSS